MGWLRLPLVANRSCFGARRFERNSRAIQSQAALGDMPSVLGADRERAPRVDLTRSPRLGGTTAFCARRTAGADVKLPFAMTGPKQPRARVPDGKGRRRHPAAHRGAATAAGHVNSRHARPSVGHRPTVEGWGPAQSRCRKGLRRSLAGVPCALDTGWVVQMAVLDHVHGERGVIETWPSSRRR